MSSSSSSSNAWFRLCCTEIAGDDEKMPDTGSKPCSSLTPVSFNVIPVFLINVSAFRRCDCEITISRVPPHFSNFEILIVGTPFVSTTRRRVSDGFAWDCH